MLVWTLFLTINGPGSFPAEKTIFASHDWVTLNHDVESKDLKAPWTSLLVFEDTNSRLNRGWMAESEAQSPDYFQRNLAFERVIWGPRNLQQSTRITWYHLSWKVTPTSQCGKLLFEFKNLLPMVFLPKLVSLLMSFLGWLGDVGGATISEQTDLIASSHISKSGNICDHIRSSPAPDDHGACMAMMSSIVASMCLLYNACMCLLECMMILF